MPTPTYTPLANVTLSSSATSVTFSSIPATYRDLVLVIRGVVNGGGSIPTMSVNGNSTGYNTVWAAGNGSSTGSSSQSNDSKFYLSFYNNNTSLQLHQIYFMDYSQTNKHKTVLARSNQPDTDVSMLAQRWANTNSITSITVNAQAIGTNQWAVGSTFALYGIAA